MLERVLEQDPTEFVQNHVKIFSRDHTLDTADLSSEEQATIQPEDMYGTRKKDLTVAVRTDELKNTLLIDDDPSYTVLGQEKNLLRVNVSRAFYELLDCVKIPSDQRIEPPSRFGCESFYILNKLFYAAGVLRDVCETYSRDNNNTDLTDIMWTKHASSDKVESYELLERLELYQSGLEVLREINSDVGFLDCPVRQR